MNKKATRSIPAAALSGCNASGIWSNKCSNLDMAGFSATFSFGHAP